MKKIYLLALITTIFFSLPSFAAGKMRFGKQDVLHFIQDVKLKDSNGDKLYVARKITINYFIAGLYLIDDGYVFPIKKDQIYSIDNERINEPISNNIDENEFDLGVPIRNFKGQEYYTLTNDQITSHQKNGLLPSPLPGYKIGTLDYMAAL